MKERGGNEAGWLGMTKLRQLASLAVGEACTAMAELRQLASLAVGEECTAMQTYIELHRGNF